MYYPLVSVVIPVGGNSNKDNIMTVVESIWHQDYPKNKIEILLVVDPETKLKVLTFSRSVQFVDFVRPTGTTGRDTNARAKKGWDSARGEILAHTGVRWYWGPQSISTALRIMRKKGVQALDGIAERMPNDQSFLALFQDESLVTEFPRYKEDFLLGKDNFGQDFNLPILASFFMTRDFYDKVKEHLPIHTEDGWEDFDMVRAMCESGGRIYCTRELVGHRNNAVSLRLGKHFTSGISGFKFIMENPANPYAQKRLRLTLLATIVLISGLSAFIMMVALNPLFGILFTVWILLTVFTLLGIYNCVRAKMLIAVFFPPLTALQIIVWLCGFFYGGANEMNLDREFIVSLHNHR